MPSNSRIHFGIKSLAIAPDGVTPFQASHVVDGIQSVGLNTKFNLEQAFELGQSQIYQNIEGLPDVEATAEKVLDGRPLIYHMATYGATSATLLGRSTKKASLGMSIFSETQDSASGTPITEVFCSGTYISSLNYTFPVEGNFTESVTIVGNNKVWLASGYTLVGYQNNDRVPANLPQVGVGRRQHFVFGNANVAVSGADYAFSAPPSVFPIDIDGIDPTTGYNLLTNNTFGAHVQSVRVSANLGRDALNELGRKGPYSRYVNIPVEIRTDIEVISTRGDMVSATEFGVVGNGNNLSNRPIFISTMEGTKINLGNQNLLSNITEGGANAGSRGGNETVTYSFVTYNTMTVTHPNDPTVALRA